MLKTRSIASLLGATAIAAVLAAGTAHAAITVVTFDDLPGSGLVPDGYGGVTWFGDWTYYGSSQPPYTPESPPNRVYDFLGSGPFAFSSPTVFDGAYFSGYSYATVTFDLYSGPTLVWTSTTLAPSSTPTWLPSGYSGLVTSVSVVSPSPDFFVMDNVTYGTAIPEPATWAMMLLGFAGLGFAGYRLTGRTATLEA